MWRPAGARGQVGGAWRGVSGRGCGGGGGPGVGCALFSVFFCVGCLQMS